jgi:ribose/xylose/arabinose/galactoside ABC-type transport system permease subunit
MLWGIIHLKIVMINIDNKIFRRHPEIGVLGAFIILLIVFSIGSENFRSLDMATSILTIAANVGIIALGCAFLMIAGEFDLSVGSVYLFSTLIFVSLANAGIEPVIAFFASLYSFFFFMRINDMSLLTYHKKIK